MSGHDAFERILTSLHEAMLDDVHWPTTTALIDEACGLTSNALLVGEGPKDDLLVLFAGLYYRGQRRETWNESTSRLPSHRRTCAAPAATARPVGPGRAVPGPRERPPPPPEQYGAVPHIDSGILPYAPRSCDGVESPCVQAEARVRMPLTRSPRPRSVPARCRRRATRGQRLQRCCAAGGAGPGPAVLVIGTAAVKTVLPEIPPEMIGWSGSLCNPSTVFIVAAFTKCSGSPAATHFCIHLPWFRRNCITTNCCRQCRVSRSVHGCVARRSRSRSPLKYTSHRTREITIQFGECILPVEHHSRMPIARVRVANLV